MILVMLMMIMLLYTVYQKTSQNCFCYNFVKLPPNLIIFATKRARTIELCKVHSFSTSSNLCQHNNVWNTNALNWYIMRRLFVSDCSFLHHLFDGERHVI